MGLMSEVGALGQALKSLWLAQYRRQEGGAGERRGPQELVAEDRDHLRVELAGVLAGLLKIANDAGIDLEEAYVDRMAPLREQP
jgi:NTP pyrophosphatase (non-canonical NTP hydrolase)